MTEKAAMVEPVDPFEDGKLDSLQRAPGSSPADDLSLEQPVDGFGQCIVIAIAKLPTEGSMPASARRSV